MDAIATGKRIQELRKQHNWTQRELAEKLNVSDKAVSKWERGLNFPDMALLKPLADTLDTSVASVLGLEEEEQKVELITAAAAEETSRLRKEICNRSLICIMNGLVLIASQYAVSIILNRRGIYDSTLNALTIGLSSFTSMLIGNCLWIWWKHRK